MKHFSHPHPLELSDVPEGKEVICSCCGDNLVAGEEAYFCAISECKFSLHKTCSEFPKKLKNRCRLKYDTCRLILHSEPPSEFSSKYDKCTACENKFPVNSFIYYCEFCYDYIHPKCACAPKTVKRGDHQHPLKLYSTQLNFEEDYINLFRCGVCEVFVHASTEWVYYCSKCEYGTHFGCVNVEPAQKESSDEEEEEEETAVSEDEDIVANQEDEENKGENCIRSSEENPQPHFSHHHDLSRLILDEGEELKCRGCHARNKEPFHGCISCKFYLHESCLKTPRFLDHPYHPNHALNLLPAPTHPSRSFICDACGLAGKSFCFSCAQCDCDLHIQCAALPQQLTDPEIHDHVLTLAFGSPAAARNCNVCEKQVDAKQWAYNCRSCDYDAHLGCAYSGYIVPVEEREDEDEDEDADAAEPRDGKPGDVVEAINQSMANMNELAVANAQAMERMAMLQLQTNLARMNANAVANMCRW